MQLKIRKPLAAALAVVVALYTMPLQAAGALLPLASYRTPMLTGPIAAMAKPLAVIPLKNKPSFCVYDYDGLASGVLAKGKIFTGEDGKYGSEAAGEFVIKQMAGTTGLSSTGQKILAALVGAGLQPAQSRTVYQEKMNNGATREISTRHAPGEPHHGQIEYVHTKAADGKERVVVFSVGANNYSPTIQGVDVVNFNTLAADEQNTILASLPVMNEQDPSAVTSKLVTMQDALNLAKLAQQAQGMGFELDARSLSDLIASEMI